MTGDRLPARQPLEAPMSFIANLHNRRTSSSDPLGYQMDKWLGIAPKTPPPAPAPPNRNDALNASKDQADSLRQRRGIMGNIFGGQTNQTPSTGTSQLGT